MTIQDWIDAGIGIEGSFDIRIYNDYLELVESGFAGTSMYDIPERFKNLDIKYVFAGTNHLFIELIKSED